MKNSVILVLLFVLLEAGVQAPGKLLTFCNPLDLSYRFQLSAPSRREAADPTLVLYKNKYWLFASKSGGYWYSDDLSRWTFVESYDIPTEDYAPTAVVMRDTLFFLASNPRDKGAVVYKTAHPETGRWEVACPAMDVHRMTDPALFLDDDGRLYFYWGCSNVNPLYGVELDPYSFRNIGKIRELYYSNKKQYGWEVFGDFNTLYDDYPWIEGAWMNKLNGKYYLQYAGPGTQWKSYSDAVLVSENPLGPFSLQQYNPFAYKPEGFVCGAGHGSTFTDKFGNLWHIGTSTISVKHRFERRLSLFPAFLDENGTLYACTQYGDYPLIVPDRKVEGFEDLFPGWMLLSFGKKVEVSSEKKNHSAQNMVDETIRTYWSAVSGTANEWAMVDLGTVCTVNAIQLNFAEDECALLNRPKDAKHRFVIEFSIDRKHWTMLIDASQNNTDNTHRYFQLHEPVKARYVKLKNKEVPDGNFALSGLRVFGNGTGKVPDVNKYLVAVRLSDRRAVKLNWDKSRGAIGYVISYGISPEKLYQHYMVYDQNELVIHSLDAGKQYFYTIEAFNENGITPGHLLVHD